MSNNNLNNWAEFSNYARDEKDTYGSSEQTAHKMGFQCTNSMLSKANARFRLAKEIKDIKYDSYSTSIAEGYTALIKALLTASAVELYLNCVNKGKDISLVNKIETIFSKVQLNQFAEEVKELRTDSQSDFLLYLSDELHKAHKSKKEEINKFIKGESFNAILLLISTRHLFVHGKITPTTKGVYPKQLVKLINKLCEFTLNGISEDFESRFKRIV